MDRVTAGFCSFLLLTAAARAQAPAPAKAVVVPLAPRPGTLWNVVVGASGLIGSAPGVDVYGGGLDLGLSFTHGLGRTMAAPGGGSFAGLRLEPRLGIYDAGYELADVDGFSVFMLRAGVELAYERVSYAAIDPRTASQLGWGPALGYYAGAQYLSVEAGSETHVIHGPVARLLVGSYRAGLGRVLTGSLHVTLLDETGSDLYYVMIGGGAAL